MRLRRILLLGLLAKVASIAQTLIDAKEQVKGIPAGGSGEGPPAVIVVGSPDASVGYGTGLRYNPSTMMVSVDVNVVPMFLRASGLVMVPTLAPGDVTDIMLQFPGVLPGDSIIPQWPAMLNLVGMMIPEKDRVVVRLHNPSKSPVLPGNYLIGAMVIKKFVGG